LFAVVLEANKPYQARLAELAKNSRERGGVHSGGGFGRMVRIAWYSAKQLGAQPSGTDSFRRTAGSGQGAATGHSHNVAAGYLAILNILELTPPECTPPLSWRPFLYKFTKAIQICSL
jgi:hypothetical protein